MSNAIHDMTFKDVSELLISLAEIAGKAGRYEESAKAFQLMEVIMYFTEQMDRAASAMREASTEIVYLRGQLKEATNA